LEWSDLSYGLCSPEDTNPEEGSQAGEIVAKLRQVDVLTSQDQSTGEGIGVSKARYYLYGRRVIAGRAQARDSAAIRALPSGGFAPSGLLTMSV